MLLNELFKGAPAVEIEQLSTDSRSRMKNAIFFCYKGIKYNGHQFVDEAIKNGAIVIVHQDNLSCDKSAIYIRVNNVDNALQKCAEKFYDDPGSHLKTIITAGSYGRSSVNYILSELLNLKQRCGQIGVLGIRFGDNHLLNTLPALTLLDNCRYMTKMIQEGFEACVFETSVLGLSYHKMDMIKPDVFIFTNTGLQSRDYREVGQDYYEVLRRYLYTLENTTLIVFNRDDSSYNELRGAIGERLLTFGLTTDADFMIDEIVTSNKGSSFTLRHLQESYRITTPLLGINNIRNITAALVGLYGMGYDLNDFIEPLTKLPCLNGVMEKIDVDGDFNVYVDCGKTIESLNDNLAFLKSIVTNGRLIAIVGVNGFDDSERIANLVKTMQKHADLTIYTEDNSEDREISSTLNIVNEYTLAGCSLLVERRYEAIEIASGIMRKDDILVVFGKGNENFLVRSLAKDYYETDKVNLLAYFKKRYDEENEEY